MRFSLSLIAALSALPFAAQAADYRCDFAQRCDAAGCTAATDMTLTLVTAQGHALLTDPNGPRVLAALPGGAHLRSFAAKAGDVGAERAELFSLYANGDFLYTTQLDATPPVFLTGSGHCTGAS